MGLLTKEYYYVVLVIFSILAYFIVTDNSVATYFVLMQKFIKIRYEMFKWWILNNPRNPIVRYFIWKRSIKLAEEMQKQFSNMEKDRQK